MEKTCSGKGDHPLSRFIEKEVVPFPEPLGSLIKQQRRRQLQKRHLKSEFALLQTSSCLFHLVQFVKCWRIFLDLNFKGLYQSSEQENESRFLVFTSSTNV